MIRRFLFSRTFRALLSLCVALPAGYLLLAPLGHLFDWAHLSVFNTWALMHATAIVAWPLLSLGVFLLAWRVIRRGQRAGAAATSRTDA